MKHFKSIAGFLVLAAAIGIVAFFWRDLVGITRQLPALTEKARELVVKEVNEKVLAPPPLRSEANAPAARLTRSGVIAWTNAARRSNGFSALKENTKLDAAATAKLNDMFAKQYFAHEGPDGNGPSHWVEEAGYAYIIIGENLALGNFADDKALVDAWMASPGHRANILHPRFWEIGVAVGRGQYEGRTTWLAVQEFGLARSACPTTDETLKAQIDANEHQIDLWKAELDRRRAELNRRDDQEIDEYNALVAAYNALVDETKRLVVRYNVEVEAVNACVQGP